jgi:hypothetical protein
MYRRTVLTNERVTITCASIRVEWKRTSDERGERSISKQCSGS